jgi:hypothetical protein
MLQAQTVIRGVVSMHRTLLAAVVSVAHYYQSLCKLSKGLGMLCLLFVPHYIAVSQAIVTLDFTKVTTGSGGSLHATRQKSHTQNAGIMLPEQFLMRMLPLQRCHSESSRLQVAARLLPSLHPHTRARPS